jgi:hypothetical protein
MQVTRRKMLRTLTLVAGLAALASCSTLPTSPTRTAVAPTNEGLIGTHTPDDVAPTTVSNSIITSKTINGRYGGVITAGHWKVVVPPDAFVGIGVITISVPDTLVDRCDLSISPPQLNHFNEEVDLRYLCSSMKEAQERDMRWWNPQTSTWVIIESWPNSDDISRCAPLSHFSSYASGGKAGW